jgi:hypothetical protein
MASTTKATSPPEGGLIKQALTRPIANPVLVSVGRPALPHETPVYAWQTEGEEGKQLMRKDSPELALNFTGKNSKLL